MQTLKVPCNYFYQQINDGSFEVGYWLSVYEQIGRKILPIEQKKVVVCKLGCLETARSVYKSMMKDENRYQPIVELN